MYRFTTATSISLKEIGMSDLIYNESTFQVNDGEKHENTCFQTLHKLGDQ